MVDFKSRLSLIREHVWSEILPYLPDDQDIFSESIREYPLRQGKYLRPGLVILSCEMFGGKESESRLTAAAMQLSEEWLLVHDDIEDHSEERRSTEKEKKLTLNKLYGDEIAVNAGDALHIIMWKILGNAVRGLGPKIGWKIFDKLNEIVLRATKGQSIELDWIRKQKLLITEAEYLGLALQKTAYYTIIGPIQLGAIIARAHPQKIKEIEIWGKWLGYVFQLTDDILNLTVDSKVCGKERGGDILEGKRTIILSHLLENCSPQERLKIEQIYGKNRSEKTEIDKNFVLSLMEKYGSIDHARKLVEKYFGKLMTGFNKSTLDLPDSEAKRQLIECMEFIKKRKR